MEKKKKLKVTEEFVLTAYEAACGEWKARIEGEFPKLFVSTEDLVEGNWVFRKWSDGDEDIFLVESYSGGEKVRYVPGTLFRNGKMLYLEYSSNHELNAKDYRFVEQRVITNPKITE
jgi:hypothetical protein